LAKHRIRTPQGAPNDARRRALDLTPAEVTDIIPFNEFGGLPDATFTESSVFERDAEVIAAPELDDLHETEEIPLRLVVPEEFRPEPGRRQHSDHAYRDSHTDTSDGSAPTEAIAIGRRGEHRKPEAVGAAKGRLMIAAMAAGATAAGAYSMVNRTDEITTSTDTVLASGATAVDGASISGSPDGVQIVTVASAASSSVHNEALIKAAAYAQERAEREARLTRPLFAMPTRGVWTSGFGYRWGVLHGGIDIANAIGTPIYAAADGEVIEVGPAAGYGALVKIRHHDGTVTLYGHINSWNVSVGDRVMAGDQIATMGNRGFSTGPHLHFEVLLNGTNRVDPTAWLAKRGLRPGG